MMEWMEGPLKGYFTSRRLSDAATEPVELIPFDITLALTGDVPVDTVVLTDAVQRWISEIFDEAVAEGGYRFSFERVGLRNLHNGVRQQSAFQITYEGMSYWGKGSEIPSETTVAAIQLDALGEAARSDLLIKLRAEDEVHGLGSAVVAARGDLNRNANEFQNKKEEKGLDVIIIVAIVIAVLASFLLAFALFMAWKTGTHRKDASYREGQEASQLEGGERAPPSDYDAGNDPYPDSSIISADISSSLSAYYKSGMAGGHKASKNQTGPLNDAASVSSMESYGYSLDGYASSIAN